MTIIALKDIFQLTLQKSSLGIEKANKMWDFAKNVTDVLNSMFAERRQKKVLNELKTH